MQFIYVFLGSSEWEDLTILLTQEEAIQMSLRYPENRVAIFSKKDNGYVPIYNYYENGRLVSN